MMCRIRSVTSTILSQRYNSSNSPSSHPLIQESARCVMCVIFARRKRLLEEKYDSINSGPAWIIRKYLIFLLASVLDATVQICMDYRRTQLELLEASRNFVKAEIDQQAQLQSLAQILSSAGQRAGYEPSRIIPFHQPVRDTQLSPPMPLAEQSTFPQSGSTQPGVDNQYASLP